MAVAPPSSVLVVALPPRLLALWTAWAWSSAPVMLLLATAAPTTSQGAELCSTTVCGGVNISFPFGIVADPAAEPNCGMLEFQVLCSNNTPHFGSSYKSPYSFRILDIFYNNNSLLIADDHKLQDFNNSPSRPCHSPGNNSSTKLGPAFSISPVNQNMIFYGCEEPPMEAVRQRLGLVDTSCGNKTLVGVTNGFDVSGSYSSYFLEGCSATVVPMLARPGEGVNPANYLEFISGGFLLTWQLPPSLLMKNG